MTPNSSVIGAFGKKSLDLGSFTIRNKFIIIRYFESNLVVLGAFNNRNESRARNHFISAVFRFQKILMDALQILRILSKDLKRKLVQDMIKRGPPFNFYSKRMDDVKAPEWIGNGENSSLENN